MAIDLTDVVVSSGKDNVRYLLNQAAVNLLVTAIFMGFKVYIECCESDFYVCNQTISCIFVHLNEPLCDFLQG